MTIPTTINIHSSSSRVFFSKDDSHVLKKACDLIRVIFWVMKLSETGDE